MNLFIVAMLVVYASVLGGANPPEAEYWDYDAFGRLVRHTDYQKQDTGYVYNALGQLWYKKYYVFVDTTPADGENDNYPTAPAEVFEYRYDTLGRQDEITKDGILQQKFYYDADGRIHVIDSPQGVIEYLYSSVTGQKTDVITYAAGTSYESIVNDTAVPVNSTTYAYDDLGRLEDINGNTSYTYNAVGSRENLEYANGNYVKYEYNALNRLETLTNWQSLAMTTGTELSIFSYALKANGMRASVTETVKVGATPTNETRTVEYGYDNLNRLTSETATAQSPATGEYSIAYTYDLAGNRTERIVTAENGPSLKTTYAYDSDTDRLLTETHTEPIAAIPYGDNQRVYAYAGNGGGGITYQLPDNDSRIGQFKAFWLGLPSVVNTILFYTLMVLIPVVFFWPVIQRWYAGWWHGQALLGRGEEYALSPDLRLWHRMLCVLLAYIFLVGPEVFQYLAQADVAYSQISTLAWGQTGRTIEYDYDANGSLTSKTTKEGTTTVETVVYDYNLQNRLAAVTTTPYVDGQPQSSTVTAYWYNPAGIRVGKLVDGTTQTDYLIDQYNHTGYAQVIQETTDDGINLTRIQYTLGDDVISQTKSIWVSSAWDADDTQYLLYDGHGSTRQLARPDKSVIDSYSYDAYGVMLGDSANPNPAQTADTNLLYAGEQYDKNMDQYYLRARYYNQNNGTFNQMDNFAGNMSDPQSLHKYAYVHNNPVNGIDPSGLSINWGVLGKWIHAQIGIMYKSEHIGAMYGKSIPGLAGALIPDIMDYTLKEIAEIKPLSPYGFYTGPIQLCAYLVAANLLNIPGAVDKMWTPSTWDVGVRNIPLPPNADSMIALTLGNAGGLIFYKVFNVPKDTFKKVLLAALIASLADHLKNMMSQMKSLAQQGYNNLEGNLAYFSQQADTFFTLAYSQSYAKYGMNVSTQYLIGGLLLMTGITAITARFGYA